ncbi:MAG: Mur ligase family protein, partial [Candidatus Hinthialibacter sp.]
MIQEQIHQLLAGPAPQLSGLRGLVVGMGESGQAAAELMLRENAVIRIYDADPKKHESLRRQWTPRGVQLLTGDLQPMDDLDFCVISPGVPPFGPFFQWLRQTGVPLLGEMELACRFFQRPIIAVTGTNGKTTVTGMITHILNQCGRPAEEMGNVGYPVAAAALT